MPITDIYSKRNSSQNWEFELNFTFPKSVRIQISFIIIDALWEAFKMPNIPDKPEIYYKYIHDSICRELGYEYLWLSYWNYKDRVINSIVLSEDTGLILDIIDLTFRIIDFSIRNDEEYKMKYHTISKISPDDAILELNHRLTENNIWYRYENWFIYKIDSNFSYTQIIKPVLTLLKNPLLVTVNEEYIKAHEHYKYWNNKDCLAWALKSLESILKIICDTKWWEYNQKDTAKKLLEICFTNNLIPQYLQSEFTSLRALIESGIPTIRNSLGWHWQWISLVEADNNIVAFWLNLTWSSIIYLAEQAELICSP